jgi:hypothetical protein
MQEGEETSGMDGRFPALALALSTALLGCAGSAWRHARGEDTIAAYHSFLKEYPDSRFSDLARARLELSRLKRSPTLAAITAFRERYATPELMAELDPFVDDLLFRHTRAVGTADAYRRFLEEYPNTPFRARAQGNLVYLERNGFIADSEALARFAQEHPESDYAAEAVRSVSALRLRSATTFDKVGVVVDVNPSIPGADRLRRVFHDRAAAAYAAAGISTDAFSDPQSARDASVPAILTIRHDERETSAEIEKGTMTEPAIVARTEVKLERADGAKTTIWSDVFEYRAPLTARRDNVSILFSPGSASSYWTDPDGEFFVPVARWNTEVLARRSRVLAKPAVALDVAGTRSVVLFGDGDFQVFDLGDPENLVAVAEYRRERDLSKFDGVRVDGSHVAIFGPDGLELVALDGEDAHRERVWGRDRIGSVVGAERIAGTWWVATNRGLLRIGEGDEEPRTLIARPIFGMARAGDDRLLFTDGVSLYTSSLSLLQSGRVDGELRLGRGFQPQRIRSGADTAIVLGTRDAVRVDLRSSPPRILSRINTRDAGRILDASTIGDQLFLIGPRGLQVTDPSGERIVDSVDVVARSRVEAVDRHLVMVGEKSLQVVDATPFVASEAPASRSQ